MIPPAILGNLFVTIMFVAGLAAGVVGVTGQKELRSKAADFSCGYTGPQDTCIPNSDCADGWACMPSGSGGGSSGGGDGGSGGGETTCPDGQWQCNNNCANAGAQQLFNDTWCDGKAQWLSEAGCGGPGGAPEKSKGPCPGSDLSLCSSDAQTARICREPTQAHDGDVIQGYRCYHTSNKGADGLQLCGAVNTAPPTPSPAPANTPTSKPQGVTPTSAPKPSPAPTSVPTKALSPTLTPFATPTPWYCTERGDLPDCSEKIGWESGRSYGIASCNEVCVNGSKRCWLVSESMEPGVVCYYPVGVTTVPNTPTPTKKPVPTSTPRPAPTAMPTTKPTAVPTIPVPTKSATASTPAPTNLPSGIPTSATVGATCTVHKNEFYSSYNCGLAGASDPYVKVVISNCGETRVVVSSLDGNFPAEARIASSDRPNVQLTSRVNIKNLISDIIGSNPNVCTNKKVTVVSKISHEGDDYEFVVDSENNVDVGIDESCYRSGQICAGYTTSEKKPNIFALPKNISFRLFSSLVKPLPAIPVSISGDINGDGRIDAVELSALLAK